MRGEQQPKYRRTDPICSTLSQLDIRRQRSFFNSMNIYAPGMFERSPEQLGSGMNHQGLHHIMKQEHDNVFMGFVQEDQQSRVSKTRTYERECLEYEKYLFDNRIRAIIKRMAIKAYSIFKNQKEGQFFVFPIQRLLISIAKKMLLNRFQLLFLQYVFEQTKWHYGIQCIRKHVNYFKSYIMLPDSQILNESLKMVQIYILYCAYFSKKSLNELQNENMFMNFVVGVCPKFMELFSQWTQKIFGKINPKQLNSIFKKLSSNLVGEHEDVENYCLLVQEIIDISPAYNADKASKQPKPRKKNKEIVNSKEEEQEQDGRDNQIQVIVQHDEEPDQPQLCKKKESVLSVDLLEPVHYLNRKSSQQSSLLDRKQ